MYRVRGTGEDTAAHPCYISYGGGYCSEGAGEAKSLQWPDADPSLCLMMKELAFQVLWEASLAVEVMGKT